MIILLQQVLQQQLQQQLLLLLLPVLQLSAAATNVNAISTTSTNIYNFFTADLLFPELLHKKPIF